MQQFFDFPMTPALTFETFISCDGNTAALQFARRIADADDAENLLYLHGPSGSGKTHLLKSISFKLSDQTGSPAPFMNCAELDSKTILFERFDGATALIIDDLHLLADRSDLRASIWQVFNDFYSSGRKVALAGLHPPRELPNLDDHLVSRLLWGLVARVDASDDESRRMILKKAAEDRQVRISDEVVEYLLSTSSREVRELLASFDAIYSYSMSEQRRITLPLARECNERRRSGNNL